MEAERIFADAREISRAAQEFVRVLGTVNRANLLDDLNKLRGGVQPPCDATFYLRQALGRVPLGHRTDPPYEVPGRSTFKPSKPSVEELADAIAKLGQDLERANERNERLEETVRDFHKDLRELVTRYAGATR